MGWLFNSSCSDFLAVARRLSQCKRLCLMLDGFMLLILSASPSTALIVLLNSSEIYRFAKNTSIFAFCLMNPSLTFSLDNYSLFLRGGGRKGFPLETQLASATQRNNKSSATDSKSLKGSIYPYWEKQKACPLPISKHPWAGESHSLPSPLESLQRKGYNNRARTSY